MQLYNGQSSIVNRFSAISFSSADGYAFTMDKFYIYTTRFYKVICIMGVYIHIYSFPIVNIIGKLPHI